MISILTAESSLSTKGKSPLILITLLKLVIFSSLTLSKINLGIRQQLFFVNLVKSLFIEIVALNFFGFSDLFVKINLNKTRFTLFLSLILSSSKIIELSLFGKIL